MVNNTVSCPYCGGPAKTMDGVFNFEGEVATLVQALDTTQTDLANLLNSFQRVQDAPTPEQAEAELVRIEESDPSASDLVAFVRKYARDVGIGVIVSLIVAYLSGVLGLYADHQSTVVNNYAPVTVVNVQQDGPRDAHGHHDDPAHGTHAKPPVVPEQSEHRDATRDTGDPIDAGDSH